MLFAALRWSAGDLSVLDARCRWSRSVVMIFDEKSSSVFFGAHFQVPQRCFAGCALIGGKRALSGIVYYDSAA